MLLKPIIFLINSFLSGIFLILSARVFLNIAICFENVGGSIITNILGMNYSFSQTTGGKFAVFFAKQKGRILMSFLQLSKAGVVFLGAVRRLVGIKSRLLGTVWVQVSKSTLEQKLVFMEGKLFVSSFAGGSFLLIKVGYHGIGTWVPGSALQVNGTGIYTGELYVNNNGTGTGSGSTGSIQVGDGTLPKAYGSFWTLNTSLSITPSGGGVSLASNGNVSTTSGGLVLQSASGNVLIATGGGNVGINTTVPVARLDIVGNVGVGITSGDSYLTTTPPNGGMIVESNVGIGSLHPGQALDVTGTTRTTNFTMSGQGPGPGYVLESSDSSGDATWEAAGGASGWTTTGNNVYETLGGNVGIGTTLITTSALTVMNGNVGIIT